MPRGPDGRTVLTRPYTLNTCNGPVVGRSDICCLSYRIQIRSRRSTGSYEKRSRTKGHFPNEEAARKLIYLSILNATPKWTRVAGWTKALLAFKIHFGDRLPD